jgi:hypothetical protein
MFWLRLIYSRLYGLLRKNRIEQEMDDEISSDVFIDSPQLNDFASGRFRLAFRHGP